MMMQMFVGPFTNTLCGIFFVAGVLFSCAASAMVSLNDDQLSNVTGQALMQMNKEFANGFTFYTAGLDAVLELNMNVEKLQLGCGGINGAGCDLDIDMFSLGCITNASGNCISLNPQPSTNQRNGAIRDCGAVCGGTPDEVDLSQQLGMKDFEIQRPFFQFAIKNDQSKTLREVVGIRLGGENVNGPLGFGSLNSFSGLMSASSQLTMQGESGIAITDPNDFNSDYNLGLDNFCAARVIFCVADADQFRVEYDSASRSYPVLAAGNRQDKAFILNTNLSEIVNELVSTVSVTETSNFLGTNIINLALPLFETQIGNAFKDQLAAGLGLSNRSELVGYDIPYNLDNVHQITVDSGNFGLSFQKESVRYPGYQQAMATGWSMYAPDAFNLVVSQPASEFVNNIVSGAAANGDIIGLEAPYRNCWGSARFC